MITPPQFAKVGGENLLDQNLEPLAFDVLQ
jgi:hypothetical protein